MTISLRILTVGIISLLCTATGAGEDQPESRRFDPILIHAWTPIVISNQAGVFKFWLESSLSDSEDTNTNFTGRVEVSARKQATPSATAPLFDSVIVSLISATYEVICELREIGIIATRDDRACGLTYVSNLDTCLVPGFPDSILVSAFIAAKGYLDSAVIEESIPITMLPLGLSPNTWWSATGRRFPIEQPQPYPFGPVFMLDYSVPRDAHVLMTLWDSSGVIDTLIDQDHLAGDYRVDLKALDKHSGVYFYSLEVEGSDPIVRKMVIMK